MGKIIKLLDSIPTVVDDTWIVKRGDASVSSNDIGTQIWPFSEFKAVSPESWRTMLPPAVWISPDDDFEPLAPALCQLSLIAVDFPSFRDGRGYSIGYLLRSRYGWKGELRAIGDVLRDQLNYMRRCGFDAFAVRTDKSIEDAIKSFNRYSVQYQGAVDQPLPLFRRRHGNS
jgi:uncharacterized protein (DUF934 family)